MPTVTRLNAARDAPPLPPGVMPHHTDRNGRAVGVIGGRRGTERRAWWARQVQWVPVAVGMGRLA